MAFGNQSRAKELIEDWKVLLELMHIRVTHKSSLPMGVKKVILPTTSMEAVEWRYSVTTPPQNWYQPGFDDSLWKKGKTGFGVQSAPGRTVRTMWKTSDIWIRRTFTIPQLKSLNDIGIYFIVFHNNSTEIYINGIPVERLVGASTEYLEVPVTPEGKAAFKQGENTIAVHCMQTNSRQFTDVGIYLISTTAL